MHTSTSTIISWNDKICEPVEFIMSHSALQQHFTGVLGFKKTMEGKKFNGIIILSKFINTNQVLSDHVRNKE